LLADRRGTTSVIFWPLGGMSTTTGVRWFAPAVVRFLCWLVGLAGIHCDPYNPASVCSARTGKRQGYGSRQMMQRPWPSSRCSLSVRVAITSKVRVALCPLTGATDEVLSVPGETAIARVPYVHIRVLKPLHAGHECVHTVYRP
jgi:hypothetical protein